MLVVCNWILIRVIDVYFANNFGCDIKGFPEIYPKVNFGLKCRYNAKFNKFGPFHVGYGYIHISDHSVC